MFLLLLIQMISAHALEVVKPEINKKIELKIVRAEPESFGTYSLMNHNGREMILICAKNRVYDDNAKAMIEYRNYYNEIAGYFTMESDRVCKEMGQFIEAGSFAISESKPFLITLNPKDQKVEKIVYPKINIYTDEGNFEDLLPKKPVFVEEKDTELRPIVKPKS